MYQLTLLGPPALADGRGREISSIVSQPERLLLLAWMACEEPTGFRKRDDLLARFFPSGEPDARRNALRQSLHALRTHIDPAIFVARGSDELMVNSALLACDLLTLRTRLRAGETVDRETVAPFAEGLETDQLPAPVAQWVEERRLEVEAIRNGTAEFPVPTPEADEAPASDAPRGRSRESARADATKGGRGETGKGRRTEASATGRENPPERGFATRADHEGTRAARTGSRGGDQAAAPGDIGSAPSGATTTRADYAERLSAKVADTTRRPRPGDEPATQAWTLVAGGVFVALAVLAGTMWWRGRADRVAAPSTIVAPDSTTAGAAPALSRTDSAQAERAIAADSFDVAEAALRRWMQQAPASAAPVQRLAELFVRAGRLEASVAMVDSARARGAGDGWAREQRLARAMAGGFWPVARDLILDSTATGMTPARARWWRVAFERMRGRSASAAEFARTLESEGIAATPGAGEAVGIDRVRATRVAALVESGVATRERLAGAAPIEQFARARLSAATNDTTMLRLLVDSLARQPNGALPTGALPFLRAQQRAAQGDRAGALTVLDSALSGARTEQPVLTLAQAQLLLAEGRASEAVIALRAALRAPVVPAGALSVPYPVVREQLALAHMAAGARDSARVHARVALEAWSESEPAYRARAAALRRAVGLFRRPRTDSVVATP